MAERHAVASGEDERHEENTMRDIHIGKRGSETAIEEQSDKIRVRRSKYKVTFNHACVS